MRIDIVTVLPELLRSPFEASIMKRAIDKGLVEVHFIIYETTPTDKKVDDYPYGGGGMVMTVQPIDAQAKKARETTTKSFTCPRTEKL
jgi:tRNA (guanine37-N1)-methyltransferase